MRDLELVRPGTYVLEDVLAAVLATTTVDAFVGDSATIHEAFYRFREKFPLLRGLLSFTAEEVYHYSRQLEEGLSALEISRIIGMDNPDYDRYVIKTAGREFVQKNVFTVFSEEEVGQIKQMAREFAEKCGTEPQTR